MTLHHSFSPDFAVKFGVEVSILIHHFQYWIRHNKAQGINFFEGKYWTFQTYEQILAHFPYWSRDQLKRILKKSIDEKILVKGNFNKNPYDHTIWYAFNDEALFGISNVQKRNDLDEKDDNAQSIGRNRPIYRR